MDELLMKIQSLGEMFDTIPCDSKRSVLQRSFQRHLNRFVFKMEDMYYKKIIQNKSVKRIQSSQEKDIEQTFKTLEAFLPMMIAYSTCSGDISSDRRNI